MNLGSCQARLSDLSLILNIERVYEMLSFTTVFVYMGRIFSRD